MSRFEAAYHQYRANNKGLKIGGVFKGESMSKLPDWDNFINEYLRKDNDTFHDPLGEDYLVQEGLWDYTRAGRGWNRCYYY